MEKPQGFASEASLHELACAVGWRLYVVEEFVPQGDQKRWAQSIALEVIYGGRAVA